LHSIPEHIAEVAQWLGLDDIAVVSAASSASHRNFWQASEAWRMLAASRGLNAAALLEQNSTCFIQGEVDEDASVAVREALRRHVFHINSHRLEVLDAEVTHAKTRLAHAEILTDAAHMARGLMPQDGPLVVAWLCRIAERALQAHDPTHPGAARAAAAFLAAVRQGKGAFDVDQLERLAAAHSSARHLQELLEAAVQEQHLQTELQNLDLFPESGPLEAEILSMVSPSQSQTCHPTTMWNDAETSLENEHEARRCNDIDALLDELNLHIAKNGSM